MCVCVCAAKLILPVQIITPSLSAAVNFHIYIGKCVSAAANTAYALHDEKMQDVNSESTGPPNIIYTFAAPRPTPNKQTTTTKTRQQQRQQIAAATLTNCSTTASKIMEAYYYLNGPHITHTAYSMPPPLTSPPLPLLPPPSRPLPPSALPPPSPSTNSSSPSRAEGRLPYEDGALRLASGQR